MRQVGAGEFIYQEVRPWGQLPPGWTAEDAPAVAVDSHDRVYVITRHRDGVLVLDRDGNLLTSWTSGLFKRPHGICIGPDDAVHIVDDWAHSLHKFTADGRLLMTIETRDHPSDTGYVVGRHDSARRAGPPFNQPTAVALSPEGDLYVSDGYGNARVHRFSPDGRLLFSWGEPGDGPGQFGIPHGVWVDRDGRVYVSDRLNARIQVFSPHGEYISQWEGVHYPDCLCIDAEDNVYVAELGSIYLGHLVQNLILGEMPARVTVRDLNGRVLAEWGEEDPFGTGRYFAPHGIAVDSRGDLYVSEAPASYALGEAPSDWGVIRKYIHVQETVP